MLVDVPVSVVVVVSVDEPVAVSDPDCAEPVDDACVPPTSVRLESPEPQDDASAKLKTSVAERNLTVFLIMLNISA